MKSSMLSLIAILAFVLCQTPTVQAIKQVYAINVGGRQYTSTGGVKFENDRNTQGKWRTESYLGINGSDTAVFSECRLAYDNLTYTVPLDGDGWYALGLAFSDDPGPDNFSKFNVLVNGQEILKNFNMLQKCGAQKTCNQIFYFDLSDDEMRLAGKTIEVDNNKLTVQFVAVEGRYAVVDAIFVMKSTEERQTIFSDKTEVFFDPKKRPRSD